MRFSALPSANAHTGRRLAALVATVFLAPAAALAASSFEIDCHQHRDAHATAESDLTELDLTVVDLTTPDETAMKEAPLIVDDEAGAAPVLDLGPRVATLVRDIFGVSELDEAFGEPADPKDLTMAPLAENGDDSVSRETLPDSDADADDLPYSPVRVHREMYRTDI